MYDVGGPVVPGVLVAGAGLGTEFDLRRERRISFLVHGYNVNRSDGSAALQRLAEDLTDDGRAYVGVLWPGDHWTGPVSYPFEGQPADDTAATLVRYIKDIVASGAELSFATHSLGARVALGAVARLPATYPVTQVCLMAAAIDDDSVANRAAYRRAVQGTTRVAVLASERDVVLRFAYPAGDFLQSLLFEKDYFSLALGYHGPRRTAQDNIPAQVYHVQIPTSRGADHGDYLPGDVPNKEQLSAVRFTRDVLQGIIQPNYI
jgi:pimeloyl-ACP methyl ester carboxylesterase